MTEYPDLHVVFDCADPDRVAKFWIVALPGYDFPHGSPDGYQTWVEWRTPTTSPRTSGTWPVRSSTGPPGAGVVQRVDGPDGFWLVMHDVEGNEFCVI